MVGLTLSGVPQVSIIIGVVLGLAIYAAIAIGCGAIMSRKGRSGAVGILLVLFLGFIGILIVVFYPPAESNRIARARMPRQESRAGTHAAEQRPAFAGTQPCGFCGSRIPLDAMVCRVCHVELATLQAPDPL